VGNKNHGWPLSLPEIGDDMSDFFEVDEQRRAKRRTDGLVKYFETIHALAAGMIPDEKAGDEFDELCRFIGKSLDDRKRDVGDVQRATALAAAAAHLPETDKALAAAEKVFRDVDAKNVVKINKLRTEVVALMEDRNAKSKLRDAAKQAAIELENHRREHWQLFGLENPAEVAKRCHVAQEVFGAPEGTAHGVVRFEEAMLGTPRPWAGKTIFPLKDQAKFGEFAYFEEMASRMIAEKKQGRYLLPRSMELQVKIPSVVFYFDDVLPFGKQFRLDQFIWLRPPGWTQLQVDDAVRKLAARLKKDYPNINTNLNHRTTFGAEAAIAQIDAIANQEI
jgi:hypothetical protein